MPYAPKENASLDALIDHVQSVVAGLAAVDALAGLERDWLALLDELKQARGERDEKRFALLKASRKVRVLDRLFDRAVVALSRQAQADAGGTDRAPYDTLFGTVKSADITGMGPEKATVAGKLLAEKAKALGGNIDNTKRLAAAVEPAAAALAAAHADRQRAKEQVLLLAVKKEQLAARVAALAAQAQVGILTAFPGDSELVRAVLAVDSSRADRDVVVEAPADAAEG